MAHSPALSAFGGDSGVKFLSAVVVRGAFACRLEIQIVNSRAITITKVLSFTPQLMERYASEVFYQQSRAGLILLGARAYRLPSAGKRLGVPPSIAGSERRAIP